MNRRLAARELHHFGIALGAHQIVQHLLDLFHCEAEPWPGVGKAQWTIHVAIAIDLNNTEAGMLLVVGAKAAVVRASVTNLRPACQRNRAWLVVFAQGDVCGSVSINERFKRAALWTTLPHIHF